MVDVLQKQAFDIITSRFEMFINEIYILLITITLLKLKQTIMNVFVDHVYLLKISFPLTLKTLLFYTVVLFYTVYIRY